MELVREKFRLFAARAREALDQDGEPFAVLEDLLRRNAQTAASDAAVQHALAGAGEHIWMQAEAEQQELGSAHRTADRPCPARGHDPRRTWRRTTSRC